MRSRIETKTKNQKPAPGCLAMPLSAAERNKRKRERKKKEKEIRRKEEEAEEKARKEKDEKEGADTNEELEIEIEYVAEPITLPKAAAGEGPVADERNKLPDGLPPAMGDNSNEDGSSGENENDQDMDAVLRRFHQRAAVAVSAVVTDDERKEKNSEDDESSSEDEDDEDGGRKPISKRKLRELVRPSVAELKRRVQRPDLVEAHDITAPDPEFLIHLKGISGTVPVPRHWGRKRKYLQGKRGYEKPPFQLPDFIVKTGITEIRDTLNEDEAKMSAKQKNRGRVAPKMGAMDVDYKTLHEAFFRHQTKPTTLTKLGDLYYEGKELETSTDRKPGGPLSEKLRDALGMLSDSAPPPWLLNMQRYGPPPSYPSLAIPGLNSPLPNENCQYGYHVGGWGKPPLDQYGRPLYGGNPFDPPGTGKLGSDPNVSLVTSDGKPIVKSLWGGLPVGDLPVYPGGADDDDSSDDEESSDESSDGMDESSDEEETEAPSAGDGIESVLPPPTGLLQALPGDLRKQPAGDETPSVVAPKQLYQVLEQKQSAAVEGAVFQSDVQYVVPGATKTPEGAESVLSKAVPPSGATKRKRTRDVDEDDDDLGKNFKF